ncbi:MAG: hypothetical protein QXQ20_08810 [Candidatus Nezhaarchaeales archaeon]
MEEIEIISKRPFYVSREAYYFVFRASALDAELGLKIEGGCFIPITEERDEEILRAFLSELPHFILAILKGDQEYIEVKRGISLTLKRWVEEKGGIRNITFKDVLELLHG